MNLFNVIAGTSSIISLFISIVSLYKIKDVETIVKTNAEINGNNNETNPVSGNNNQTVRSGDITRCTINQRKSG